MQHLNSLYVHDIGRTNMGCPTTTCVAHDQLLYLEGTNLTVVNNIRRLATVGQAVLEWPSKWAPIITPFPITH